MLKRLSTNTPATINANAANPQYNLFMPLDYSLCGLISTVINQNLLSDLPFHACVYRVQTPLS